MDGSLVRVVLGAACCTGKACNTWVIVTANTREGGGERERERDRETEHVLRIPVTLVRPTEYS